MGNRYVDKEIRQIMDNAIMREKERLQRANHQRNVAAIIDFTSNLMSLLGRRNGVRNMPVTALQPTFNKSYADTRQRYDAMLRDYKGLVADELLRKRLAANKKIEPSPPEQPAGSIKTATPLLRSKGLENDIYKTVKQQKEKNYVFSKF